MDRALAALIPLPGPDRGQDPDVLAWGCPVPFFGHLESARLATVGINPSDREFTAADGTELTGQARRLPTLSSLGLTSWPPADTRAARDIAAACCGYFERNPYRRWFGILQQLIAPTGCSYYPPGSDACHLDLIPWATSPKWALLRPQAQASLLRQGKQTLARVIACSPVVMLILNGREVTRQFESLTGQHLNTAEITAWELPRRDGRTVKGFAYSGTISTIAGVPLGREILVTGYNHNLQSSFGISSGVRAAISDWVTGQYQTALRQTGSGPR